MPKRRSDGRDGGRTAKRRQRHIYLVFDDWLWGYSVRKVDLLDSDSGDGGDRPLQLSVLSGERSKPPLPRAIFRLEAPHGLPFYFASAFGARIMAMHPRKPKKGRWLSMPKLFFPILDVRSRGVFFAPRPKADPVCPIYISVDDMLFALASGSLEVLASPPLEQPDDQVQNIVWSWCKLENPPFERQDVTSYAVHPDGRTILFSTVSGDAAVTYGFDTKGCMWSSLGKWRLPFTGCGHFDVGLDAFIGLSDDPATLGHLYSCDSSDVVDGECLAPAKKLSKERVFSVNESTEVHLGATLVYLRKRRFCLVQCIGLDDYSDQPEEEDAPPRHLHLLRLITFSLKYDKNGDLTTGKSRRVQYCKVPEATTESVLKSPVAFWL